MSAWDILCADDNDFLICFQNFGCLISLKLNLIPRRLARAPNYTRTSIQKKSWTRPVRKRHKNYSKFEVSFTLILRIKQKKTTVVCLPVHQIFKIFWIFWKHNGNRMISFKNTFGVNVKCEFATKIFTKNKIIFIKLKINSYEITSLFQTTKRHWPRWFFLINIHYKSKFPRKLSFQKVSVYCYHFCTSMSRYNCSGIHSWEQSIQ
jgi:hypothetical protein